MSKAEVFLGLINPFLQEHLNNLELSDLEKKSMNLKIYHIFQQHEDTDDIYHELLEYLMDDLRHAPLISTIDDHYFHKLH